MAENFFVLPEKYGKRSARNSLRRAATAPTERRKTAGGAGVSRRANARADDFEESTG